MDFGSIAIIRKFYDSKLQYENSKKQLDYYTVKTAYKTALTCLKAEHKRESLTDSE